MTETSAPTAFYTKPLETWTFRELHDALGPAKVADLLCITRNNLRQLYARKAANLDRMAILQAAIREEEAAYRNKLVTLYTTGAYHARPRH